LFVLDNLVTSKGFTISNRLLLFRKNASRLLFHQILYVTALVEALEEALRRFGRPEIFNTDQGSQFTSDDFIGVLKNSQIKISMDGKGRCMDNVFVERLWRSLKYEEIYLHAYASVSEAKSGIGAWLNFYNEERLHQTHDYRTPRQVYEAQCRWVCGRSAPPTGCAFAHIPTGTAINKGFNNDGLNGIIPATALS
jgi:integrase-like protein